MNTAKDVCVQNLYKSYGQLHVLDNVSFDVPARSFTCIVGPSGCGKTTLLRALLGLESTTSGHVNINPERMQKGMAYVAQAPQLLPWRTTLQNVSIGAELREAVTKADLQYVRSLIEAYGLGGFEDAYPEELSGGMKQRASILRAFARRPAILLCDEPFSSIDFVTRLQLNTTFKSMCRVEGITVLFVTHNIEEALYLADEIVVLSGRPGRIVGRHSPIYSEGTEDAVKCRRDPEFARLFDVIWTELRINHVG